MPTTPTITGTTGTFARGTNKTVVIVPEAAYGTAPAAASAPGQLLRRNSAVFNLTTQLIASQEINPSQQTRDARQGPRSVQGTVSGNMSPASYTLFWEALLRSNFAAGPTVTGIADSVGTIVAVGNGNNNLQIVSPSTSWTTAGFCQGDVVRVSGLTGSGPSMVNGDNRRVLGFVGAHGILLSGDVGDVGWPSGQTIGIAVYGKKLLIPASGQIVPSFTFEEYFSDVNESRVSTGCRLTQASINVPASGFVSFSASFTGQQQVVSNTQVYTNATAASTTTALTAVGGAMFYKGKMIGYVNTLSLQIASQAQANPVVGSNLAPDVLLGKLTAQGSFSCLFTEDSMQADYLNEVEVDLSMLLTTSTTSQSADFFSIYLPRVKLSSATVTDSDSAITRSFNFMAMENINNPVANDTTIVMQDSLA